ncbi:MAG: OmpA family protein [Deltaproteobacteria bacterium]|nr:OmpA family protein [Deltaproteobacteria bacterium]
MKPRLIVTVVLAFTLSLGACKKKPPEDVLPSPLPAGEAGEVTAVRAEVPQHVQDMATNFGRVFFDFDSADLTDPGRDALRDNAGIMGTYADVKVEIQGHADDRGTTEYNLALGQRRADAVYKYLVAQGVAPGRLTAVSFGEERPLDRSNTEIAWAQNRRAEFRITWASSNVQGTTE